MPNGHSANVEKHRLEMQPLGIVRGSACSCKLNHIDPQSYLQYVLERIADHPINRIEELLPWNVVDKLNQPEQVTKALAA